MQVAVAPRLGGARAGHRLDRNHDTAYEHSEAVSILDRWWAKWIRSEFMPSMGAQLSAPGPELEQLNNDPNLTASAPRLGTRWAGTATRQRTCGGCSAVACADRWSRVYCGGSKTRPGTRRKCQSRLRGLAEAWLSTRTRAPTTRTGLRGLRDAPKTFGAVDAVRTGNSRSDQPATDPLDQQADVASRWSRSGEGGALAGAAPLGHAHCRPRRPARRSLREAPW